MSNDKKLANKIMTNGISFFSNFIPFREKVGILDIINIEGTSK